MSRKKVVGIGLSFDIMRVVENRGGGSVTIFTSNTVSDGYDWEVSRILGHHRGSISRIDGT
jgi:hypothetical protein